MKPDPKHQASLQALLALTDPEIRRRADIKNFKAPDYVATEVLVSLVRTRFGATSGLLDRVVGVLYGRLMRLIEEYFRKNPQWHGVVNSSSETLVEATSAAWEIMNTDKNLVSFAEVRFLPWVEARAEDYLRQQLAEKNRMPSHDAMNAIDEDGNEVKRENLLAADEEDSPEAVFERKKLSKHLFALMMSWEPHIRYAVYYRLEFDYDWDLVAELLHVSKPTARKYYNIGIERLNGEINE